MSYSKQQNLYLNVDKRRSGNQIQLRSKSGQSKGTISAPKRNQNANGSIHIANLDAVISTGKDQTQTQTGENDLITLTEKVKQQYDKLNPASPIKQSTQIKTIPKNTSMLVSLPQKVDGISMVPGVTQQKRHKSINLTTSINSNQKQSVTGTGSHESQKMETGCKSERPVGLAILINDFQEKEKISEFELMRLKNNLMPRTKQTRDKSEDNNKLSQPPIQGQQQNMILHKSVQNSCKNILGSKSENKNVHQKGAEYRENLYANGSIAMQKIQGLSGLENFIKKRNGINRNNHPKGLAESHNQTEGFERKPSYKTEC